MSRRRFTPRPPRLVPRILPRNPFRRRRGNAAFAPIALAVAAFAGVSAMLGGGGSPSTSGGTAVAVATAAGEQRVQFGMCGLNRYTCVVDGDTIWLDGVNLRLQSYDTPEPYDGICGGQAEVALAKRASARLLDLLNSNEFTVETFGIDGTGKRTLATVRIAGQDVGDILIAEGLARRWPDGDEFWC